MDQAARGAAALKDSNYEEAITQYTAALSANPNAVPYYIQRSMAYQRSGKYSEALADAEMAVVLAHRRARREQIKDAQLRRGIALFFLERYADAEFALSIVQRLDAKEKTLQVWQMKVAKKLKELEEGDERGKVTAVEIPDVEPPSTSTSKTIKSEAVKSEEPAPPAALKPIVPTPANKIKHDWYQSNENVTFTLLAKGVSQSEAKVEIDKDSLNISFPIKDSSDFNYSLDPFYAPVDPSQSTFRITPTKIEVTLKKATPGIKWHALEGDHDPSDPSEHKTSIPSHILAPKTNEQPPAYPTSSRKGVKDWDKVAKDLTAKKTTPGEDGDDYGDLDDFDGDETTRFFKHLYKGADPDQQRAMMKSYQESGGTVLSTDWSNVGSKTVGPEPPDGMEAKKF
ncbi:SGS-domain-containing protein [Lindgomyces ingoldianus]|uniref:SGS-domain-containing protein n=1 Tax=Lindgomyces ingoldianus TaxID=673940 RepID=A0ACB6QMV3_9PLEO|nr:SGS-domain-containing protein [Lindgomyces ingoldianus]KAF2467860.1 SGS-domain-containing protein [Lindgomyces ingoldianus]